MSNELTISFTDTLVVITCWCGINHAVPQDLRNFQRRQFDNGDQVTSIYCPLGHRHQPAGKGKAQIERERREQLEARLRAERDQHEAERRSHAATKGQLTKERNRTANGVCPCCQRSFVQLSRHMRTKHPDFVQEQP